MILVTGATGQLGSAVVRKLLKTIEPNNIIALARDERKADNWKEKGVQVRIGDYGDKESLLKAFQGVSKLLLVTSIGERALEDHNNVIEAAKQAGVAHFFYVSGASDRDVEISQLGPIWDSYVTTENNIKASGLQYTIFQNSLYAETVPFFIGEQVLESGIYLPAGEGKTSFAKRDEMGEAIANAMIGEGHENKSYLLTGEKTYSFAEIAEILSELAGKEVTYNTPEPEEYQRYLEEYGVSSEDIGYSLLLAAVIKNNEYDIADSTLSKLLGRPATTLKEYLKQEYFS